MLQRSTNGDQVVVNVLGETIDLIEGTAAELSEKRAIKT